MVRAQTENIERQCIVSRKSGSPDDLMRFVCGPDGQVVADLRQKLPGRGCWVTGTRDMVEKAVSKKLFSRGLKEAVHVDEALPDQIDSLLVQQALQAIAMARKAGQATSGSMQVDKAVRNGQALATLSAIEAAADGVRKITQARKATVYLGGPNIPAFRLFTLQQMDLAFVGGNVIHAAILDGGAGNAALRKLKQLDCYRHGVDHMASAFADVETDEE